MPSQPYRGRFAPSPSGPLHAGSLIAAMASWLDARAHQGAWLLRMEDIDAPRAIAGADRLIMQQLQALHMQWDEPPIWQQSRLVRYQEVFDHLLAQRLVYGCACTRQEISLASPPPAEGSHERPYPGTCRHGIAPGRSARAWRLHVPEGIERFRDRWMGWQQQNVAQTVGDFTLKRADGLWAYQLVVVVDDADQGISHVVRGADLLDSTPRQRVLQRLLNMPHPDMLHVPLALDEQGRKLSKQNHAPALDLDKPVQTLNAAWTFLGFTAIAANDVPAFWAEATRQWARRFISAGPSVC